MKILCIDLTNPDWWVVFFTAISTVAVIVIAIVQTKLQRQQTKLQKRQTEAQEYDIYKRLYLLLHNTNTEIDNFLYDLWRSMWEHHYIYNKDFLSKKQTYINELKKDLLDSYVDYVLKFSDDAFDKDDYYNVLSNMSSLVQQTISSIEDGTLQLAQGVQRISYNTDKEDEAYAKAISQCYKTHFDQAVSMHNLSEFIKQKRKIRCDDKFLEKIKERCKID